MMDQRKTLVFDLLCYWHIGTGRGANAQADALVAKDPAGLPYLPGKTVRGLVRDAAELAAAAGRLAGGTRRVLALFGSPPPGAGSPDGDTAEWQMEEQRFTTQSGSLWFGSAQLPEAWRAWAASLPTGAPERSIVGELYTHVASTAIGPDGVVAPHTLRVREVTVPLSLRAEIRGPAEDRSWADDIGSVLGLIRALGSRRQRGYGRVRVRMEDA